MLCGNPIVWAAAPGEAIVTTYPFSTYAAGWGTSFSAPFVSGRAALMRSLRPDINESMAASASAIPYFRIYDLRSTYTTRLSAGAVADEWVTQMLRQ